MSRASKNKGKNTRAWPRQRRASKNKQSNTMPWYRQRQPHQNKRTHTKAHPPKHRAPSNTRKQGNNTQLEPQVLVKLVRMGVKIPKQQRPGDAGYDITVLVGFVLTPGAIMEVTASLSFGIPKGYYGQLKSRSSMMKKGLWIDGVIDSGYTGEVFLVLRNMNADGDIVIKAGDRIAQIIFIRILTRPLKVVKELPKTVRGDGGFGSTGKSKTVAPAHSRRGRSRRPKRLPCTKGWQVRDAK
jgi:dUTP pyrophosphatase